MTVRAAALAVILSVAGSAAAATSPGPFGLRFGMTTAQAVALGGRIDPNLVNTVMMTRPPSANSAFSTYMLRISPTRGLCSVIAIGPDVRDGSGLLLRNKFRALEASLTSLYGRPEKIDKLKPGSPYTRSNDWILGVLSNERTYTAEWSGPKVPKYYFDISLEIAGSGRETGYITLGYTQSDLRCMDDLSNSDKTGL